MLRQEQFEISKRDKEKKMKRRFFTIASRPIEAENETKAFEVFMGELKENGTDNADMFRPCEIIVSEKKTTEEEKFFKMLNAKKEDYVDLRACFEGTLVEHGWTKVEYRDWNTLKRGGVEIVTRDTDFEVGSGIFQSRCDYDGLELDEDHFTLNGIRCSYEGWNNLPEEVLSDSVSKDELRQWIADERELRGGAEAAEIVLGHCEENWELKE